MGGTVSKSWRIMTAFFFDEARGVAQFILSGRFNAVFSPFGRRYFEIKIFGIIMRLGALE